MQEVVVSVGMGPQQLAFIKRLKQLGYTVAAFGKGKNSEEAMALADYVGEVDTHNPIDAVEWINSLNIKVIAVGSFAGGGAVYTVQYLSNYYHCSTAIPDEFIAGSDKDTQQKLLEKYKLSSIKTWSFGDLEFDEIRDSDNRKYILKPAVGRGSEGIRFLEKPELLSMIEGDDEAHAEDVVQEVREGDEYRTVVIVQGGEIKLLAPIRRTSYKDTVFLGILKYEEKDLERLTHFLNDFIKSSGIKNSIFKADIIVSKSKLDVIEMDIGVGGGTYFKQFVSRIYNRNLMDEYIHLVLGKKVEEFITNKPALRMDYVFNHYANPICYDVDECKKAIDLAFGECEIQINQLHPERKGGFCSNADFIFTVMYEDIQREPATPFAVDEFVNTHLFTEIKE